MDKKCFKCKKIKPIDQFYKHKKMVDGHLNKCKGCAKKDVRRRYYDPESRSKIREYEKKRFQTPERKKKAIEYQRKRRQKNPSKNKARNTISNGIRDGKITKQPCQVCGNEKVEAHHVDYRMFTEVIWLCFTHHRNKHGQTTFEQAT